MQPPGSLRIERLSPALGAAFLAFFDHERGPAFADNPRWSGCYCHFHEMAPALDWESLPAEANRTAMTARIAVGEMEGYLAFRGDDVVGWLNAQPRHRVPHCFARLGVAAPAIDVPAHDAAVVLCFVVAPAERGRGVARALLAGALDDFAARGIALVDAFPLAGTAPGNAASHYHGPRALFESAGFAAVGPAGDRIVMRRRLDAPSP
jgi:GNAT superfamily N-acetyltransferase